jgi:hypothetical protein
MMELDSETELLDFTPAVETFYDDIVSGLDVHPRGVVIGDVPSWRVDNMPYGGVKDSSLGSEGVRFAAQGMTKIRNLVIRTPQNP